jgi:hypothetical protein
VSTQSKLTGYESESFFFGLSVIGKRFGGTIAI